MNPNRTESRRLSRLTLLAPAALALGACASPPMMSGDGMMKPAMQADLPEAVRVPAGHRVAMETVGAGTITYECRAKADAPAEHAWVFVGPDAVLKDRAGAVVGRYYGPPATWEANDGSKITATQLAVAPAGAANIPLQLVKANPAMGGGTMAGVAYIQRLATRGGTPPAMACTAGNAGSRQTVNYQADYVFWKAS